MCVCVCATRVRAYVFACARSSAQVAGACGGQLGPRGATGPGQGGGGRDQRRRGAGRACFWRRVGGVTELGYCGSGARSWVRAELLPPAASSPSIPRSLSSPGHAATALPPPPWETVAGGGCPVRSKPAGRCRTPTPGSGERARPCPGSDNCGGGGGGSAVLVAGLSDRSQRQARSERRVAGGAVWACAPDPWLAGGTQRPGATRPSAWSAPRGCAEAAAATVAMQPAQRRPGPGTAARSLEDAGRAAPRPLTEVRARPRAHGPPARPLYPSDSFPPRVSEGWCSNREGEAERLLPFLFLLSRGEPPDEMLTESFSSPAMFQATATREVCSGLTSFPVCMCVLRGRGAALGNFEELLIPLSRLD